MKVYGVSTKAFIHSSSFLTPIWNGLVYMLLKLYFFLSFILNSGLDLQYNYKYTVLQVIL